MNCQAGDLAICVGTEIPDNNGVIVRVVRRHVNTPEWNFGNTPTWWCESDEVMTWNFRHLGVYVRAYEGAVPDAVLRPIRPPREDESDVAPAPVTEEEEALA